MPVSTMTTKLAPAEITLTLDRWDRPVVVLPDDIAERLAVSSHEGTKNYGFNHFESRRFAPGTFETDTVRTIFDVIVQTHPDEQGLRQYGKYGTGYFYGYVVGASGWDLNTRTWNDYDNTKHLRVFHGLHIDHAGRSYFGS